MTEKGIFSAYQYEVVRYIFKNTEVNKLMYFQWIPPLDTGFLAVLMLHLWPCLFFCSLFRLLSLTHRSIHRFNSQYIQYELYHFQFRPSSP